MTSMSMLVTALHIHQAGVLAHNGLAGMAGLSFTISAVTMVATMWLVGRALDAFRTRFVLAAGLCVQASSLVAITFATDLAGLWVYALIFGLNNAFTMTMFGYLWPRYFGRAHLGKIQGVGQTIAVIGASIGPLPVGYAFDMWGEPTGMLRALALIPLSCAVLAVLFLRTPKGVEAHKAGD